MTVTVSEGWVWSEEGEESRDADVEQLTEWSKKTCRRGGAQSSLMTLAHNETLPSHASASA